MANPLLPGWVDKAAPIIGMLHLPPLPGSPWYGGFLEAIHSATRRDAEGLVEGGVDGLLLENLGDRPYYPGRVPAITATHMATLALIIQREFPLPLGVNVLRNDGDTALAVAHAGGADFIRVNVLAGSRLTDQGLIEGTAHELLRERVRLRAEVIRIFADVDVKHSASLAARPLADETEELIARAGADALIVSGAGTGRAADVDTLKAVKAAAGQTPVIVGSGVAETTAAAYRPHADGFIVGTAFKRGGRTTEPVEVERVRALVGKLR